MARIAAPLLFAASHSIFCLKEAVAIIERITYQELCRKEVINVCDGSRLGTICDLELDAASGTLLALIVPGPPRCFGLLKSGEEFIIPFCKIKKLGEDVILVEIHP